MYLYIDFISFYFGVLGCEATRQAHQYLWLFSCSFPGKENQYLSIHKQVSSFLGYIRIAHMKIHGNANKVGLNKIIFFENRQRMQLPFSPQNPPTYTHKPSLTRAFCYSTRSRCGRCTSHPLPEVDQGFILEFPTSHLNALVIGLKVIQDIWSCG